MNIIESGLRRVELEKIVGEVRTENYLVGMRDNGIPQRTDMTEEDKGIVYHAINNRIMAVRHLYPEENK